MPISRRYLPEWSPGEASSIGMDFSFIVPVGVGLVEGSLSIFTNTADPQPADADFDATPVSVRDRALYCQLSGGVRGRDYQLRWTAADTDGNLWPRTALLLCAETS